MSTTLRILTLALCVSLAACGGDEPAKTTSGHLLASDISDAVSIKAALEMEPGATVAVFGRVQEVTPGGLVAFQLVDDSIDYCGRGQESCGCETPWDYCCEEQAMFKGRIPVEVRGADGEIVKAENLDLQLLDLVAIKGKLSKTKEGGLFLVAEDGWFRRERPKLPEGVAWPD